MATSNRTKNEWRAQRCVEQNPDLFAKQIRGEEFTVEESQSIVECVDGERQVDQGAGLTILLIVGVMILVAGIAGWFISRSLAKEEKEWQEERERQRKAWLKEIEDRMKEEEEDEE